MCYLHNDHPRRRKGTIIVSFFTLVTAWCWQTFHTKKKRSHKFVKNDTSVQMKLHLREAFDKQLHVLWINPSHQRCSISSSRQTEGKSSYATTRSNIYLHLIFFVSSLSYQLIFLCNLTGGYGKVIDFSKVQAVSLGNATLIWENLSMKKNPLGGWGPEPQNSECWLMKASDRSNIFL